jgi:hypothetical protein
VETFLMRVRAEAVALSCVANWASNCTFASDVPPSFSSLVYKTYFI